MKEIRVFNVNGENEVFNNAEITTNCKINSLKTLEDKAIRNGKGSKEYIDILKSACAICKDEYTDSIDEIIDQVHVITVNFKINDKTFTNLYIDMYIDEDNNWSNILDSIQSFVSKNDITIFDGEIASIDWLKDKVNV